MSDVRVKTVRTTSSGQPKGRAVGISSLTDTFTANCPLGVRHDLVGYAVSLRRAPRAPATKRGHALALGKSPSGVSLTPKDVGDKLPRACGAASASPSQGIAVLEPQSTGAILGHDQWAGSPFLHQLTHTLLSGNRSFFLVGGNYCVGDRSWMCWKVSSGRCASPMNNRFAQRADQGLSDRQNPKGLPICSMQSCAAVRTQTAGRLLSSRPCSPSPTTSPR
jgi:hypothetical protein